MNDNIGVDFSEMELDINAMVERTVKQHMPELRRRLHENVFSHYLAGFRNMAQEQQLTKSKEAILHESSALTLHQPPALTPFQQQCAERRKQLLPKQDPLIIPSVRVRPILYKRPLLFKDVVRPARPPVADLSCFFHLQRNSNANAEEEQAKALRHLRAKEHRQKQQALQQSLAAAQAKSDAIDRKLEQQHGPRLVALPLAATASLAMHQLKWKEEIMKPVTTNTASNQLLFKRSHTGQSKSLAKACMRIAQLEGGSSSSSSSAAAARVNKRMATGNSKRSGGITNNRSVVGGGSFTNISSHKPSRMRILLAP